MKKYISSVALALMAVFSLVLVSCSDDSKDNNNGNNTDNSYSVNLPSGNTNVVPQGRVSDIRCFYGKDLYG